MVKEIIMPQVGQDIETAILREWFVKEKDSVKKGDIVATVDSDKATFEVEAFESGTIVKLLYKVDDEVPVLKPIALVGDSKDVFEENEIKVDEEISDKSSHSLKKEKTEDLQVNSNKTRIFATPSARRAARIHEITLDKLTGSGPNGRIVKDDVLSLVEKLEMPEQSFNNTDQAFSKMRQKIADRMTASKQNIPHFYLFSDLDLTDVLQKRREYNISTNTKISINDIIVKAVANTLRQFPLLNSHVSDKSLNVLDNINIGLAVSIDDGLLVPVISRADKLSLESIAASSQKIIENAKKGIISGTEIASFTISNLGMYDIKQFLPIINPPECAIMGIGKVDKKIIPTDNTTFTIRDIVTVSLVCDHRGADGVYGARFLEELNENLQKIEF